jgi:galactokinase
VPGRIELVGKHTDYAGGSSITVATSRGFCASARPVEDAVLRIVDVAREVSAELPLDPGFQGSGWTTYPASVVRRIVLNVPTASRGAEVVIDSDLPGAAGLSTSSALITCIFLGWAHAAEWIHDPLLQDAIHTDQDLADYLAAIENGRDFKSLKGVIGVGTNGGSQDHTAIVRGSAGQARRFRYLDPRDEGSWEWPADYSPVVLSTGVRAKKTEGAKEAYNDASELASELTRTWNSVSAPVPGIGFLSGDELNELGAMVDGDLLRRLNAFCHESAAVEAASWALDMGDMAAFASAIEASQMAAESFLGNQIPQTVFLCEAAKECGALAATSFGAGFGGSVWALVARGEEQEFMDETLALYHGRYPESGRAFVEEAGPGAFFLDGRKLF